MGRLRAAIRDSIRALVAIGAAYLKSQWLEVALGIVRHAVSHDEAACAPWVWKLVLGPL